MKTQRVFDSANKMPKLSKPSATAMEKASKAGVKYLVMIPTGVKNQYEGFVEQKDAVEQMKLSQQEGFTPRLFWLGPFGYTECFLKEEDDVETYVCYDCCRYTNQTRAEREQYDPLCKKCYEKREEEEDE